eukprot:m.880213 g.880213  ORF g.880213 m.880213 type:complete len:642 (+) comp23590_c0_seq11:366-2291(+)
MALSGGCDKTSLVGIHLQGSQSTDKRETHPELVLESDQASYVEDGLQEEKCFFLMLPSEIIYRILEFLQHNDVLRVICVCRTLKQIADTDQIWRVFLHRHCRAGHLGAVVPSDLALCNFTERVQILKLTETKGSKHVFRQLFGPRWWPQAFSDEVLLRLGLGGQGNARGVPNSQRNGRQRGSHRASHGADKPLCDRERRGGGRAKGGDVRLLGNGLFVFRAGPICNDAPWICPHCHTFVPRQPSRKRDVRVSAYKRDEDGSHAACEDASIQQDADGVMLDMSPPSCPECKNAAPPLVQSLRDGTCVVGMGSSVVGDRGKYPRSVDPHCLRVWATTFTNPPTVVRTLQPNGPEQGVFAVGDDRPNRVGLQFPFVGVGMHSGRLVVMDVRTGMVGATLPPPDEFVDTVVWMVLWGAPGQLFLLFGDSTIVEWQVCLTPGKAPPRTGLHVDRKRTFDLCPEFSDDVFFVAVGGSTLVSCHNSGYVRVLDCISGVRTHEAKVHEDVACRVDLVGDVIVSASFDGTIAVLRIPSGGVGLTVERRINTDIPIGGMSRCLHHLAVFQFHAHTAVETGLQVYDLQTGKQVLDMPFQNIYSESEVSPGNNGSLFFDWNRIIYVSDCLEYRDAEVGGFLKSLELQSPLLPA